MLTDVKIRGFKPRQKQFKASDSGGLYLLVTPAGGKHWKFKYVRDGKEQTVALGPYPEVSLANARDAALRARQSLRAGIRPGKATVATPRVGITLGRAFEQYWEGRVDVTAKYQREVFARFALWCRPIAGRPIAEIDRLSVLQVLKALDDEGRSTSVRKLRNDLALAWDWAIEHEFADKNVPNMIVAKKAFRPVVRQNMAALPPAEAQALVTRLGQGLGDRRVLMCLFQALTWCRPNECPAMLKSEVVGDLWTIPAERMKGESGARREHLVPLSRQALRVLDYAAALNVNSELVWPSPRSHRRPINRDAVLQLLYDHGLKGQMTAHGWRSVGSTWANDQQYPADVVERALAHVPADKTRAAYNRAQLMPQRRAMLQAYADWLCRDVLALR